MKVGSAMDITFCLNQEMKSGCEFPAPFLRRASDSFGVGGLEWHQNWWWNSLYQTWGGGLCTLCVGGWTMETCDQVRRELTLCMVPPRKGWLTNKTWYGATLHSSAFCSSHHLHFQVALGKCWGSIHYCQHFNEGVDYARLEASHQSI